jgi:hypothetical protein
VASVVSFATEYNTLYLSYTTKPSQTDAIIQNTLLKGLVDGGYYAKAELLYMLSIHTNGASEAQKNWKSPGTFDATLVATPAFTAYEGFKADPAGSGSYLRTGFNPTVNGTLVSQNSICLIYGLGDEADYIQSSFGALDGSVYCRIREKSSNSARFYGPNSTGVSDVANTSSIKHYAVSRGSATAYDRYINKVKVTVNNNSVSLVNNEIGIGAYGTAPDTFAASTHQVRYAFLFSYLTEAEVFAVIDLVEAYLDSYGKGLM